VSRRMNVDSSTIGLWRLDEVAGGAAIDVSNGVGDGTNYNTAPVVAYPPVPFSIARQFGSDLSRRIEVGDTSALHPGLLTIEAWPMVIAPPAGSIRDIVNRMETVDAHGGYRLHVESNSWTFGVRAADGAWRSVAYPVNETGEHHYLAGTYDGRYCRLSYDGLEVAVADYLTTQNILYGTEARPLRFGSYDATQYFWEGRIAEVRLSNRARTPWEIYNIWKGARTKDPQLGFGIEPGTVAVYNFNNALEGAVVYDDKGVHNGSMVGTVALANGPISSKARIFPFAEANYLTIPNHADFAVDVDKTVELWITAPASFGAYHGLIGKSGVWVTDPNFEILVHTTGGVYVVVTTNGSNYLYTAAANALMTAGSVNYVAISLNRTAKKLVLYLNGVPVSEGAEVGTYTGGNNARPVNMGVLRNPLTYPFQGRLHAVRWSNYVKTGKEILNTFQASNVQES